MSPEEAEEFVSKKAYQLWMDAGRPEGRDMEFWFKAEAKSYANGHFDVICGCGKHGVKLGHIDTIRWENRWWHLSCAASRFREEPVVETKMVFPEMPPLLPYCQVDGVQVDGRPAVPAEIH